MDKLIKQIVKNTLENWDLTDLVYGTVLNNDPLLVKYKEGLNLESVNLVKTSLTPELAIGDKLVMLRVNRGQKFLILGKAVEEWLT